MNIMNPKWIDTQEINFQKKFFRQREIIYQDYHSRMMEMLDMMERYKQQLKHNKILNKNIKIL